MKRITIDRRALIAGEPCWIVDGSPVGGFQCRGVVFVRAEDGTAWMEFHGDDANFYEGGRFVTPTGEWEVAPFALNLFPAGELARLRRDPSLAYAAVNRARVAQQRHSAVTAYTHEGGAPWERVRLEGVVRSVTAIPPILDPEPLNAWIETNGLTEFQ